MPESKTTLQATPGVTQLLDGKAVWKEYNCDSKKLPFIVIEQDEILPASVQAGKEIQHRFVYAACTSSDQQVIKGSLSRKIFSRGRAVFEDTSRSFQVIPGRWKVNAIVGIPPKAKSGSYDLELIISGPTITTIKEKLPFMVRK
jgi:hypothetical protein